MKKLALFLIAFISIIQLQAQNGVAISTSSSATPDASAILDVQSTTQGILIPRVNIDDLTTANPVTSPATSLMVYNTNATTGLGFFYWDGSAWKAVAGSSKINDLSDGKTPYLNLFLGEDAGPNSSGLTNTGVGLSSLQYVTGDANTALGYHSLNNVTGGLNNTGIGNNVGENITTGRKNTLVGADVAKNITTGQNNIIIGYNINTSAANANSELNIGGSFYAKNIYTTNAYFGINTASPNASAALDITSSSKGLLIPRLDIADLTTAAPVTTPATSLMAYNTNTTTGPGFFYWSGSAWTAIGGSSSVSKIDDLSDAISSNNNVILGNNAGTGITGSRNVGIGIEALNSATTVDQSVAVGYKALMNSTSVRNTAVGELALMGSTSGADNVGVGQQSLSSNTSGSSNSAIGAQAMRDNNTGSYNAALGFQTMSSFTSGDNNTAIGSSALGTLSNGSNNTALGYNAGSNITTGSNNIIIGSGVTVSSATADNEINMGSVVYATALYGTAAKVGIGFQHNAPKSTLDVKGSVSKTIVFKTGNYTATAYDYTIIYKHTSGSPILTLPDATAAAGRIYVLRTTNVTSGQAVTITAAGSDKIYRHSNTGSGTMELGYVNANMKYLSETLQSDGAGGWWIIDAWEEH